MSGVIDLVPSIGMAKKMCPRLRDSASGRGGDFTQPRTNFFGHLCTFCQSMHEENNCSLDRALPCMPVSEWTCINEGQGKRDGEIA